MLDDSNVISKEEVANPNKEQNQQINQQDNKSSNINISSNEVEIDKEQLKKKDKMEEYLKKIYPNFFSNFELLDYIDSGSTGIVYKGKTTNTGNRQLYSFKFCIHSSDKKNTRAKYHEIINQKGLHHINICQILAFYKINDKDYFSVSELGKFGDLDNFLHTFMRRRYLSETFVNYLAKPILEALFYMYKRKIYHMDIKKGNIILDSEMELKLIDFSSSFSYQHFEPNYEIKFGKIGTGRYMAPEILNKTQMRIKDGQKIDIYSFGITIYYLAFGIYPYGLSEIKGGDYDKITEKLKNGKFEIPKDFEISKKFENFLKKVLEIDYTKRYNIEQALEDPWIKGWDIIAEEKEITGMQENFIIRLISDNIPAFNQYIK